MKPEGALVAQIQNLVRAETEERDRYIAELESRLDRLTELYRARCEHVAALENELAAERAKDKS